MPGEFESILTKLQGKLGKQTIKRASTINRPRPKFEVQQIDIFNKFNRRNPKADGGSADDYEPSAFSKKVNELMDDGYDFGEAVREAMRQGYKDAGLVTKQKRIKAAETLEKLIKEDKLISFKNISEKINVPTTTVKRVYDEKFKGKGVVKRSRDAKKVIQEIIDTGVTDLNKIKKIAKETYKINIEDRNIKKLINISTDLSVDEYENIFRKMATDRTYEPPIDISAKGKGLTSNYRKAKANVKKEIPQLQKLINQNSRKRKTIKRNAKRKANPDLQTKYLAEAQTRRDTKRFREKGKIKLNPREIGLNTQQRFIIKQANDLINQNPEELLKDKKLLDKISFRVDNEGNIYKSKPDLKAVLDPKNDARFFHLSHARRAELGTELTDSPINRFASTFNQNNEFIKDAERFIENNPKDPKVNNIIKKAKELKLTLRPDVPPGTFKTKYLGYTEDLDKPVGKIKTVINQYMPKGLKSKLSKISKVAKIVGRPVLRVAAPIIPFAGPAIMAMGAADVAKAAEQGAYGLDESPVAYYLGPEAAVGLKNLKQKAALSENTPYQEIEDYLPDEDLSGILSLKGVQ